MGYILETIVVGDGGGIVDDAGCGGVRVCC